MLSLICLARVVTYIASRSNMLGMRRPRRIHKITLEIHDSQGWARCRCGWFGPMRDEARWTHGDLRQEEFESMLVCTAGGCDSEVTVYHTTVDELIQGALNAGWHVRKTDGWITANCKAHPVRPAFGKPMLIR